MNILNNFMEISAVITKIRLYKINVYATQKFSFGSWNSRQHVFLEITAKGKKGYGENIITTNCVDVNLDEWSNFSKELKGKTVSDAIVFLRKKVGVWSTRFTEMAEMCLIDLAGKIVGKSALSMLELKGKAPVCGVSVILSDDTSVVSKKVEQAVALNKADFIKVKLFGKNELDLKIIKTVRSNSPKETFLIGDVNGGYKMHGETTSNEEIARQLVNLFEAGLDACEDPAYIENNEWIDLQERLERSSKGKWYSLIPDYPMRPADVAIDSILMGMGHIYNIHPGCSGSIFDAIDLAQKVLSMGAKLMIGDDSLIGPACSIWQQLGIGLGADWIEATEKEEESLSYYNAVDFLATNSHSNPITMQQNCDGFGIMIDESKLIDLANEMVEI